jgi:hypothetical protein
MNGQEIINEEKKHRLGRMIDGLQYDLLTNPALPESARKEALDRLNRWKKEYANAAA